MPPSPAEPDTCVQSPQPIEVRGIKHCARCGGDHKLVLAMPLTQPFAPPEANGVSWSHWAPCPTNGEPIMVRVAETPFDILRVRCRDRTCGWEGDPKDLGGTESIPCCPACGLAIDHALLRAAEEAAPVPPAGGWQNLEPNVVGRTCEVCGAATPYTDWSRCEKHNGCHCSKGGGFTCTPHLEELQRSVGPAR